jgi:hypothetical protein
MAMVSSHFFMADPIYFFGFLYFGTPDAPDPGTAGRTPGYTMTDESLFVDESPYSTRDNNS